MFNDKIIKEKEITELTDEQLAIIMGQYKLMANAAYGVNGNAKIDTTGRIYQTCMALRREWDKRNISKN